MAYPDAYARQYDYQSYQNLNPTRPLPADKVNADLNAVAESTEEIVLFLQGSLRDDGRLQNGIVTYESLSASLQSNGLAGATAWVTAKAYATGIAVYQGGSLYRALIDHTSGDFATDLAAGKWLLLTALPPGPTGPTGATGATGPTGATGNTGATGAGYGGSSTTSFLIGTGSKAFTTQAGLAYQIGNYVRASSAANGANYMEGLVTGYTGTTLTINVTVTGGSGTLADWNFAVSGAPGVNGAVAISGTPSAGQFGIWTNATTQKGVSLNGIVRANGASDPTVAGTGDTLTIGTIELGAASDTTVARAAAGVISVEGVNLTPNIPQNSQSAAYTCVLADANTHIYHPSSDNNARTFTIPANASVAYPIGTTLTFVNRINTVTIAINTDTLIFAGPGSTGSRSLAANGMATAIKTGTTEWMISGSGLT